MHPLERVALVVLAQCHAVVKLLKLMPVEDASAYPDPWRLAQHALNVFAWNVDEIPLAQPLIVPVYDKRYMRTSDLPEPARSVFEYRQRHPGRPCIGAHWDACWIWDWEDFQNGQRGWC